MTKTQCNEKAQISVYDGMIAVAIFLLLYFALDSIWNTNLQNLQQLQMQNEMQFKALQAISVLVKTQGVPFNWEKKPDDANALGLIDRKGEVKNEKLSAFAAMDYNTAQFVLKVAPYDFRFEFDANGTTDDKNIGKIIDANKTVIALERSVKFKGGNAIARLKIFR